MVGLNCGLKKGTIEMLEGLVKDTQPINYSEKLLVDAINTIEHYNPLLANNQDIVRLWLAAKLILHEYKMGSEVKI